MDSETQTASAQAAQAVPTDSGAAPPSDQPRPATTEDWNEVPDLPTIRLFTEKSKPPLGSPWRFGNGSAGKGERD
jgi:hypothetical protein